MGDGGETEGEKDGQQAVSNREAITHDESLINVNFF
jgi:hypothetical protein